VTAPGGTRHRPTSRVAVPVVLGAVLANLLWLTGNAWFLLLAGAAVGVLVLGVMSRARLDGLAVELSQPPRVAVGDTLSSRLTVTNTGSRTSSATLLCLHTTGLADLIVSIGELAASDRASITIERLAVRRSMSAESQVHLVAGPSLGLVSSTRALRVPAQVVVHPRLYDAPLRRAGRQVDGSGSTMVAGPGVEVLGVRDWRSGDDPRRVHWRSTARTGRLTLLERGDLVTPALRLILVGSDQAPGFEEAVSAAASTADAAMRSGQPVTVMGWHVSGPLLAPTSSRWQLLDYWAALQGSVLPDPAAFGSFLAAHLGPGDLLVAGPAEADPGWLAAASRAAPGLTLTRLEAP
jgi:uncharacterized protein (DUF58 family)